MRITKLFLLIFALLVGASVHAGEFGHTLSIGDAAPSWTELPGTDGKSHSLNDFKDKEAVVLVFTCLSCPTAVDYEDRFNALAKKYGGANGKVGFIAVCVNRIAEDRLDKLTERANKQQFAFPVMYDESQKIAKDYGAIFTPEYFVLNKDRKIAYIGALDDSTDSTKVTKQYVDDAIVSLLKGENPQVNETGARGCKVRWARERR